MRIMVWIAIRIIVGIAAVAAMTAFFAMLNYLGSIPNLKLYVSLAMLAIVVGVGLFAIGAILLAGKRWPLTDRRDGQNTYELLKNIDFDT